MPSFQGIAGRDRLRMREKKNYQSYQFLSDPEQRIQKKKKQKKIQKIKKHHQGFSSSQNRMGKAEKERKQKLSFRSITTRLVIENSKKIAKKFKTL